MLLESIGVGTVIMNTSAFKSDLGSQVKNKFVWVIISTCSLFQYNQTTFQHNNINQERILILWAIIQPILDIQVPRTL